MEPKKRPQACKACRALKMRCDQSENPAQACARCWRTGKECVPATSRKQRDRIAELEANVQDLTTVLTNAEMEKYRIDDCADKDVDDLARKQNLHALAIIDKHVSEEQQQTALVYYNDHVTPLFPAVLVSLDLERVRDQSPMLLLAILSFAVSRVTSTEVQDELIAASFYLYGAYLIGNGTGSLDIVQALLITCLYYRNRKRGASVHQLLQLAIGMACDIGIAGPLVYKSPGAMCTLAKDPQSAESRRTWLACFVATSSMSAWLRRPDANIWNAYHTECLQYLVSCPGDSVPSDVLFCQIIQGEHLCHQVVSALRLCDPYAPQVDISSSEYKELHTRVSKNIVRELEEARESPVLQLWLSTAMIYLNEPVLHSSTNRQNFAGPGPPWSLAPTDFANPEPTVAHIAALYALQESCQEALDAFTSIDVSLLAGASSVCFTPKLKYAQTMLLKLYVAVAAPENTYGRILHARELKIQAHFDRMQPIASQLMVFDDTCLGNMIIAATFALEKWFNKYQAIVDQYEQKLANDSSPSTTS